MLKSVPFTSESAFLKDAPIENEQTSRVAAISIVLLPTKVELGHNSQTILWSESLGFCVLFLVHLLNKFSPISLLTKGDKFLPYIRREFHALDGHLECCLLLWLFARCTKISLQEENDDALRIHQVKTYEIE